MRVTIAGGHTPRRSRPLPRGSRSANSAAFWRESPSCHLAPSRIKGGAQDGGRPHRRLRPTAPHRPLQHVQDVQARARGVSILTGSHSATTRRHKHRHVKRMHLCPSPPAAISTISTISTAPRPPRRGPDGRSEQTRTTGSAFHAGSACIPGHCQPRFQSHGTVGHVAAPRNASRWAGILWRNGDPVTSWPPHPKDATRATGGLAFFECPGRSRPAHPGRTMPIPAREILWPPRDGPLTHVAISDEIAATCMSAV